MLNLKWPMTCDCGHQFKIDPIGVDVDTDVICPACGVIERLPQSAIDEFEEQLSEALHEATDDEDLIEKIFDDFQCAPAKARAKVVDDGF